MPVTIALDANQKGSWFLHRHHLYHIATGMMTELRVGWRFEVVRAHWRR